MAIDHTELSNADRQRLTELAERTGNDAVRDAVNAYLEQRESNGTEHQG